jgi:hypothetical protein
MEGSMIGSASRRFEVRMARDVWATLRLAIVAAVPFVLVTAGSVRARTLRAPAFCLMATWPRVI